MKQLLLDEINKKRLVPHRERQGWSGWMDGVAPVMKKEGALLCVTNDGHTLFSHVGYTSLAGENSISIA